MVRAVRAVVAAREKGPMLISDLRAGHPPHAHARILHSAALLEDLLALGRGEIGEKLPEARVAAVLPVELHRPPQHQPRRFQFARLGLGGKQDVQRGRVSREPESGANEDRKSTRLNSSHSSISYAVFCLKK